MPKRQVLDIAAAPPVLRQPRLDAVVEGHLVITQQLCHRHRGDQLARARQMHRRVEVPTVRAILVRLREMPLLVEYGLAVGTQLQRITHEAGAQQVVQGFGQLVRVERVQEREDLAESRARRISGGRRVDHDLRIPHMRRIDDVGVHIRDGRAAACAESRAGCADPEVRVQSFASCRCTNNLTTPQPEPV